MTGRELDTMIWEVVEGLCEELVEGLTESPKWWIYEEISTQLRSSSIKVGLTIERILWEEETRKDDNLKGK